MRINALTFLYLLSVIPMSGQDVDLNCCCDERIVNQDIVPTPFTREANVMWSTTIIRELDLRQKLNQTYFYPLDKNDGYYSLFDLMVKEVSSGCMKAYTANLILKSKEESKLSLYSFDEIINDIDTVFVENFETGEMEHKAIKLAVNSDQITRFRIKEQWIFDRERSTMRTMVIAIAPMIEVRTEDGTRLGYKPLFWINYEESRKALAAYPTLSRDNNDHTINYDDLFAKKYYDGYIVKESNVYDRFLFEYSNGIDLLIEGEKIEQKIRDMESDFWSR